MNPRLLGTLCILGVLVGAAEGVRILLGREDPDTLTYVLGLVSAVGTVCGMLGMMALKVAGNGRAGQLVLGLMLASEVATGLLALVGLITRRVLDPWPAVVGMISVVAAIAVGFLAVRAGRWEGWRKFAPFALPLALVLGIVMGFAGAPPLYLIIFSAAWLVIGYAVRSSAPAIVLDASTMKA